MATAPGSTDKNVVEFAAPVFDVDVAGIEGVNGATPRLFGVV